MESKLLEIKYSRIKGLLQEQEENNDNLLKNNLLDLGIIIDGTFTFGTGITAFLPIVRDLINQQQPQITEQTIGLLYITAMWIILNRQGDKVKKLLQIIREQGLTDTLSKIIDFLKSLEDVALKVADEVGYAASTIADVAAFTFLAFPLLDGLSYLVDSGDITLSEPSGYLKSVLISVGILTIKNVFNNIIKKVKSRFGTLEESQHIIKYNDYGIGSDVLDVVRRTLFVESEELWVLPHDVNTNKKYIFNELPHNIDLHISRNSKLKESYTLNITKDKSDNFKIILEINPFSEPKVYKNIKSTLKECFGKYGYSPTYLTLNEQSQDRTIRTVFDDSEYKILVPLTMNSFCELASNTPWCENEWSRKAKEYGTNYILYNKNTNEKTLIHDTDRVFLSRNGSSYTVTNLLGRTSSIKKFLKDSPQLIKFFNVTYNSSDMIKYGIEFSDEEISQLAVTNDFSQAVYNVMEYENKRGVSDATMTEDILAPYLGDVFAMGNRHDLYYNNNSVWKGLLDIKNSGVSLAIKEDAYTQEILNLDEDDEYYYDMAMNGSGYGHTDLEWDELDYICDKVDKKIIEDVGKTLQALNSSIDADTLCDEGTFSDLVGKYFEKDWERTGDEILNALSEGLAEYRDDELKEGLEEDLIIVADEISYGYELNLTYSQLLGIINQFNLKSFSDLFESGFNELSGGLSEQYYDAWGYSDNTQTEINDLLKEFLERVKEQYDFGSRKKNYEEFDRVIKDLGFVSQNYHKTSFDKVRPKNIELGQKTPLYYRLSEYNPINNTVKLYVGTEKPYGYYANQINSGSGKAYVIKIDEVSDYVLSDDLFASEPVVDENED